LASIFKKEKKKVQKPISQQTARMSDLQELIGNDKETYDALASTMFLNPKNIDSSMKQAADIAKKADADGDEARAGMWYHVAGGLAIYEGDVKKVVEYFGIAEKLTGQHYGILKSPEKAVAAAQEYYKKFLPT
jgi:polyribonucleotide nucleotidyltransferase